jgi:tartronate-semialdehyde synthase
VVVEIILERVTNISMGGEIDAITEFDPVIDLVPAEA